MDNLPIELIHHIFRHIALEDLVTCRLVCRKFKYVVEERKVSELIVTKYVCPWFYSNKEADLNCVIKLDKILFVSAELKLHQNLRRLRIEFKGSKLALNFVNSLQQLEELDISYHSDIDRHCRLVLPNLRVLSAHCLHFEQTMTFELKSPKLEAIRCAQLEDVRFENPLTVKHYEGDYYDDSIQMFKNLQSMHCNYAYDYFDRDVLTNFGDLKELRLYWTGLGFDRQRSSDDAYVLNLVEYIMKQKLVLRRTDFRLYLQGVEIRNKNLLVDKTYLNELDFQMRNYELLDRVPSSIPLQIDYAALVKLKSEIPADFFMKYTSIQIVKAKEKVANGDQLISFLKTTACTLEYLSLKNTKLTQEHYNQLPQLAELNGLKINEETELDYAFVLQMKALRTLKIKKQFAGAFALATKKFKRSPVFDDFEWKLADDCVLVSRSRTDRSRFSVMWFCKRDEKTNFKIKLNRELITSHELAATYHGRICQEGVITRQRKAMLSEQSKSPAVDEQFEYFSEDSADYSTVHSREYFFTDSSDLSESGFLSLSDPPSPSKSDSSNLSESDSD